MEKTIEIPEGYEARIEGNKVILEPKESKDERIRKALIWCVETIEGELGCNIVEGISVAELKSWLEKQGEKNERTKHPDMVANLKEYLANTPKEQLEKDWDELKHWNNVRPTIEEFLYGKQNPTDKVEPKFNVDDWIVTRYSRVAQIKSVDENDYVVSYNGGSDKRLPIDYVNRNCRLWTIKDAKDGDVLCTYECCEPKIVFILKGTPKKHYALSYYCYYSIMYPLFDSDSEKGCLAPNEEDVKPATKEQCDLLFQKMKEAGYKWDADKKELKKIEQNPAWSEEDEKND